jgi:hypothetical protein
MQKINQLLVPLEAGHEVDSATKYIVLRLLSGYVCIKQRCQFLSKLSGHISQKVWAICESTAPFLVFKENSGD